ncbi:unnamed protein product [Urochloa decumbens]|uniref:BHLH domain-containing protein n=1 Tax=Urochloa decumbens TaxID=240449 RepID=A0ABC8VG70_9POAL
MQGGNGYGGGYGYGGYGYGYDSGGYGYDAGAYGYGDPAPAAPAYDYGDPLATAGRSAHGFPAPAIDGVELQPSEACPKNYVIFDQARTGSSSVTYHPSLAHKLGGGSPSPPSGSCDDDGCSPAREEDSEEIDALLQSSEEEEDVMSTCSSAAAAAGSRTRKKDRIKKMVRALKGVVPGGKQMDTPAVLDEAVWYLKSLKLEAATNKKHGARGGSDS